MIRTFMRARIENPDGSWDQGAIIGFWPAQHTYAVELDPTHPGARPEQRIVTSSEIILQD